MTASLLLASAGAALPPGYEDELFCPEGFCMRRKEQPEGWVGPRAAFWERSQGDEVQAVTPWGSNHGEEKKAELASQGFHAKSCESDDAEGHQLEEPEGHQLEDDGAEGEEREEPMPAEPENFMGIPGLTLGMVAWMGALAVSCGRIFHILWQGPENYKKEEQEVFPSMSDAELNEKLAKMKADIKAGGLKNFGKDVPAGSGGGGKKKGSNQGDGKKKK